MKSRFLFEKYQNIHQMITIFYIFLKYIVNYSHFSPLYYIKMTVKNRTIYIFK